MSNHPSAFHIQNKEQVLCSGFLFWKDETPGAVALVINDESYTYLQLYCAACSIYKELKHKAGERVGVWCENDLYSYASILAVSMSGACYVPLNAKFPKKKLADIIADAGLSLVVGKKQEDDLAVAWISPVLDLQDAGRCEEIVQQPYAYILYTSGTTGIPKGVPVKKSAVNSFFSYYLQAFDFNPADRFLQPYELSFDVSVFSVFCAWNAGASVYTVKDGSNKFFEVFKTLGDKKITVSSMVPGVLNVMSRYFKEFRFSDLRYSFFSGDALLHSVAVAWQQCIPAGQIHNFYGPTETTIVCTHYPWTKEQSEKESINDIVPLGKPFPGMDHVLLREEGIIDTTGEGELCFSGPQVIDSYIRNASPESFFVYNNRKYYRTGDWCSVNTNGNLIFHGRKDRQVKINGYRIEIAEVENALRLLTSAACKVVPVKKDGTDQLVAFLEKEETGLKDRLEKYLPGYMIPSQFIFVNHLPLNLNNKIDEDQLKALLNG